MDTQHLRVKGIDEDERRSWGAFAKYLGHERLFPTLPLAGPMTRALTGIGCNLYLKSTIPIMLVKGRDMPR